MAAVTESDEQGDWPHDLSLCAECRTNKIVLDLAPLPELPPIPELEVVIPRVAKPCDCRRCVASRAAQSSAT